MIAYFLPEEEEGGGGNGKQLLQLDLTFPFCKPAVLPRWPACQNTYLCSNSALPLRETNCRRWCAIRMENKEKRGPP